MPNDDYIEGQFQLAAQRLIWWPIRIRSADPDEPGAVREIEIELQYRVFSRAEAQGFSHAPASTLDAVVRDRIQGWRGRKNDEGGRVHPIVDQNGAPLEFNPENLSAMLDIPAFYEAALSGLWQATAEVPVKNSERGFAGS